jgi:uncharacterized membrane-anchored protein
MTTRRKTGPLARLIRWGRNLDADTLSWLFFLVLMLLFLAPAVWLTTLITYEETNWVVRGGFGVVIAAVAAGLVSWVVTGVVSRIAAAREKKRRKKRKKR